VGHFSCLALRPIGSLMPGFDAPVVRSAVLAHGPT
jgi:hypothetical protein